MPARCFQNFFKKMADWTRPKISGVLLDITGVLYESGEGYGTEILGSANAVARLKMSGCPIRFVTNESTTSTSDILKKLAYHEFSISPSELFSPIPAVKSIIAKQNLHPHLIVHPNVITEFEEYTSIGSNPTCVVIGDAENEFSFDNINKAFNLLIHMDAPLLFTLGKGKYYRHEGKLQLDVGAFAAALEFACDINAKIIGKPSPDYFDAALEDMGISPEEAIMIGDDINSDVGGAQKCGMRGVLVKTGKFTLKNLKHPTVTPDYVADNLAHAVDLILNSSSFKRL